MKMTYPTSILGSTAPRSAYRPPFSVEPYETAFSRQMEEAERDRFSLSEDAARAKSKAQSNSSREESRSGIDDRDTRLNTSDLPKGGSEPQFVWHSSDPKPCDACPPAIAPEQQVGVAVLETVLTQETAGAPAVGDGSSHEAKASGQSASLTNVADGLLPDGLATRAAASIPIAEGTFGTQALRADSPEEVQIEAALRVTGGADKVLGATSEQGELTLGEAALAAKAATDSVGPSDNIESQAHNPVPTPSFPGKGHVDSDGKAVPPGQAKPAELVSQSFDSEATMIGGADGSAHALSAVTFRHGLNDDLRPSQQSLAAHLAKDLTASPGTNATIQGNHFALAGNSEDATNRETFLGHALFGSDQGNQANPQSPTPGDAEVSFSGPPVPATGAPALPLAESAFLSALEAGVSAIPILQGQSDWQAQPALASHGSSLSGSVPPITVAQIVEAISASSPGEIELRLSPEELGQVRISMREEGERMVVRISAERPETLDLLRRNADQLAAELRASGQMSLSMSFGNWSGQGQNGDPSAPASSGFIEPTADPPKSGPHLQETRGLHSGLYLRI